MSKYEIYNPDISEDRVQVDSGIPDNDFSSYSINENKHSRNTSRASESKRRREPRKGKKQKEVKQESESFVVKAKQFAESSKLRYLLGMFLLAFGVYLLISMISYIGTGISDQSEIEGTAIAQSAEIHNAGGEGGARISALLINDSFGLGALVIIVWMAAISIKLLTGSKILRFKTVNFTIKSLVALLTVSLIIGLVTIGVDASYCWGGYHGQMVNEFIISFFGWIGAVILCLFMVATFITICLRDIIIWIMKVRKKRAARKAAEAELRRLEEEKQRAIDEMKEHDRRDDAVAGLYPSDSTEENSDAPAVSFADTEPVTTDADLDMERFTYGSVAANQIPISGSESADTNAESATGVSATEGSVPDIDDNLTGSAVENDPDDESSMHTGANVMKVNVNQIGSVVDTDEAPRNFDPRAELSNYKFPPYNLLRPGVPHIAVDKEEQLENQEKIRRTLLNFGIPIVKIEATVGPTVTLYEIVPDKGVKISRITSLVDDIALSLAAIGVRIIAPIPGKGTVGIEVANKDPQVVSMQTVITSRKFQDNHYELPIAIGSTITNEVYVTDLAKMPHLLVAGATGQGKSVGLNAIITSLLYSKHPTELKFVMIDPKMVEFSLYAKLERHYIAQIPDQDEPIITDPQKVVEALSSLCIEMDNRYQLLKKARTRNIKEYNAKFKSHSLLPKDGHFFMPYIVVIVDEFSDLIMTAGKEVEMPIARLAQKARAVGIHVIIATQRPSTNVITGIIKANFPARIAFKVSSGVDSKTILDTPGAQQLIGRGDMLISNSSEMIRVQCAFVDTPEVEQICSFIENQPGLAQPYILPEPQVTSESEESHGHTGLSERDPLFEEAARLVVTSNTASTSSLQRRYSIGYNRAGKIMDQLEAAGIVGPAHGGKPRSVLVGSEILDQVLNN